MKNLISKNNKTIAGAIIIILAIVGSAMYGSGLMAQFEVGEEGARLYLNGISYNGVKYLSEDELLNGLPGSEKFKWQDDEISVDVDGGLRAVTTGSSSKPYPFETSVVDGWMPDVGFKFITNPQLIDLNGNPMAEGDYTDKLISDGHDMYVYHYSVKLQVELNAGLLSMAAIKDGGLNPLDHEVIYMRLIDGSVVGFNGLAETGILKNIYALVSIDLPEVEGWTYGWEADVQDQDWDFVWSKTGDIFETGDYGDYVKDTYPEGLSPIFNDYVVHFNLNEPQKPSHSNFDRISLVNVDGEIVGSIGLDSCNVPGVYNSWYTWVLLWKTFHSEWLFMRPTFEYDLVLKVTALDDVVAGNGVPPVDPDPPFWKGFKDLVTSEIPQEVLVGGGIGLGLIMIFAVWKRKKEIKR
jgi:hypothetical protein